MKLTLPNVFNQIRFGLTAVMLVSLVTVFSSVPFIPKPKTGNQAVKASFVTVTPMPVSHNEEVPVTTAKSVFILDMDTGIVLYAKNPNERLMPASLTKIMTAVVSMDYYNEGTVLKVNNGASSVGSAAELQAGDSLSTEDLLFALLVPSGNDAAVTLAENYPGGYYAFVNRMNQKASDLGLINSHFTNVSGVESSNHYTSAYDIAQVAVHALRRPQFRNIVSTKKITIKSLDGNVYPLETTNILLGEPGILGVKTGWTPGAGECLVTYANKYGHQIVVSVLGSEDRFGETEKLIDWVYSNYSWL